MDDISIDGMTDEESQVISETLPILLKKDIQIEIIKQLLLACPEVGNTFAMIPDIAHQGLFLVNMYKRGVNLMCNGEHTEIYEIFKRHPKYNITIKHVDTANKCILNLLTNEEKDNENIELITNCWSKLQNNLIIIMTAAYNADSAKPSKNKIARYRQRVFRSVTVQDIEDVLEAFKIISTTKEKSSGILAKLLCKNKTIIKVFNSKSINVSQQSDVIFDMIGKALNKLTNVDTLIPWLRALGLKHAEMGINPRTLSLMKPILIDFFKECLGFNFTDSLKESWIRIASFIIGMMMDGCRRGANQSTMSSIGGADGDCIDDVNIQLDPADIEITQSTWATVQTVLDVAVRSFYKDLISSKAEVRNLFNKTNLEQQTSKLVKAIGSVINLLNDVDSLVPILEELGRRHVYYNVLPKHFKYLKLAWFRMLETALALKYTKEVQEAWNKVWKWMTTIMKASLEDALLLYTPPDPEKVNLKICINHLDRIETQHMSYWADIWFAAFTNDNSSQSAAFGAEQYNREMKNRLDNKEEFEEFEVGDIDKPAWDFIPLNGLEYKQLYRESNIPWCRKYPASSSSLNKDEWFIRGNIRGTFSYAFDLHSFPIDTHTLITKFALQIDESIATFNDDNLRVRLMPFKLDMIGGTGWDVYEPNIYIRRESAMVGGSASGKRYAHCIVEIPISRKWQHYIWDTFMPLWLIEIFSFAIYFTDINPIATRMSVIAVLFLCLFTFIVTISESMPPTPYSTLMDYFFHVAKILLVVQFISQVIIISFHNHESSTHIDDIYDINIINNIVGISVFTICLLSNFYLIFQIKQALKKFPKRYRGYSLDQIAKSAAVTTAMSTTTNMSTNTANNNHNNNGSHVVHLD